MIDLTASGWIRLRSVRSTWWCSAVYVVVAAGFGWLAAAGTPSSSRADVAVEVALTGFGFAQLALVVLGVLAVSAEFGTGSAVSALVAVPRRTAWLAATTAVVVAWAALVTALVAVGCAVAARALVAVPGGVSLTDPAVLQDLGLQVAGAVLVTVLAVGLGVLLRSTAGGVGLGIALVFVLPPVLAVGGSRWTSLGSQALPALRVGRESFLAVTTTWPVGLAVAGAWAVGAWVLGALLLERRDL
ncbi:ABC transporter permease [Blastococcus sp. URHD0036]|uniref:ABC transporter permease n=1 Tax=Blastococcus sp. URHD0036 TaxID=1380356 RepID=UPI00068FAC70|nr:ABC transporter permease [Blastococcus sp. URHD0036]